jgi:hypothetical protein
MSTALPFALFSVVGCRSEPMNPNITSLDTIEATSDEDLAWEDFRTGRFAMQLVLSSEVQNPFPTSNEWALSQTNNVLLLDWERDGLDFTYSEEVCSVTSTEVFGTLTTFSSDFTSALSGRVRTGTMESEAVGSALGVDEYIDLNGVMLDDPVGEALPEDMDDPRVYDMDGDGSPGITVNVSIDNLGESMEGEVYVIQRSVLSLEGIVTEADRIEGYANYSNEQVVLGASEWWLNMGNSETQEDPDRTRSYFIVQEVEGDWSCADILAATESLF